MFKKTISALCLVALSACGATEDINGGGGGGGVTSTVPASLSGDLTSTTYNAASNTLRLELYGFDGPNFAADFTRASGLDVPSTDGTTTYQAYTTQETTSSRRYVALFASGSTVAAGAVGTETEFASEFGGTTYSRQGTYVRPTAGSARYIGGYAGVINRDFDGDDSPDRVSGDVFIRVNFEEGTEGHIEGGVSNRRILSNNLALPSIALLDTALSDGEFFGDVIMGTQDVGDYGGVLGGTGATEVAGVLVFIPIPGDPLSIEWGVFVLPICTSANASPNCP